MASPKDPIIIAGGGPTGLALALALGLENVPCVVFEAEPGLTHDLRAGSFHPPTIEMLTKLGVGEAMHARGIKVPVWQIRDRIDGVAAEFDLSLLKDETPYPYRLHIEQHRLTPLLLARIHAVAPSVSVRFASPVTGVTEDKDGVTVSLANGETHRGSFVVGCDGARSVVRQAAGVAFEGFTWPERFLVASTTFDLGAVGFTGAGYVADPENWAAIFHVPDDGPPGLWRIAYGTESDAPEETVLAPDAIQARLKIILEHSRVTPPGGSFPLKYTSTYRVHQRVAEVFAKGRNALAGDAAHLNNPMGGLGLNGGIHDAVNLAEKLVRIWHEGADFATSLDLYDRQRRPINIKAVQAMSIRNKRLLDERDPMVRKQRLAEIRETAADPVKAKAYLLDTSMINSVREAAAIQ